MKNGNNLRCEQCVHYYPVQRRTKKGFKSLGYGHCLNRTVYASNRPGKPTYPPRSKVAELPYGRHQIALVQKREIVPNCTAAKEK